MKYNCLKALDEPDTAAVRLYAVDFSKAFDNVRHSLLSNKLKALNLNPHLTNWYINVLKDRTQRLVFRGHVFGRCDVNKVTTQGSVSGPYLFNLFVNDLEIVVNPVTHLIKFADDTTMQVNLCKSK